ncbi:hypothetical protein CEXT_453161 [Caerostris extrusa]|uniref:Uncharacterized protein n=1 Tax=Caerostris extrusa TaxID=172846 RepID=A0AAV4PLG0_CAEEX|nr:hypothetical protein CEXT_453161 [Caerostris extrusa]
MDAHLRFIFHCLRVSNALCHNFHENPIPCVQDLAAAALLCKEPESKGKELATTATKQPQTQKVHPHFGLGSQDVKRQDALWIEINRWNESLPEVNAVLNLNKWTLFCGSFFTVYGFQMLFLPQFPRKSHPKHTGLSSSNPPLQRT